MAQTGGQLPPIDEQNPLSQKEQQVINIPDAPPANSRPPPPIQPCADLLTGPRENYIKIGVPLYEASIKGDWKTADAILKKQPELVRYSITENHETALHVAASAKRSKLVEEFVENLVGMMENEDLELRNKNQNTALYLAAAAGNVNMVKIMLARNRALLAIPGAGGQMMPLYTAVLFGNYDVVKYLYDNFQKLADDGWTAQNRSWLLLKCVENDMFDVALQIVKDYPALASSGTLLGVLARKPDAFSKKKSKFIIRNIKWVFAFISLKGRPPVKESEALPLLRTIWENIANKPKDEIDRILRGPPDVKQFDKTASGKVVQALQLQKLISEHIAKLQAETQIIITGPSDSGKEDQALQLQKLISEQIVKMHVDTQNIIKGVLDSVKPASGKEDQALKLQKLISQQIVNMHVKTQNIGPSPSGKEDLQKLIIGHISTMQRETQKIIKEPAETTSKETYSNRILFVAAEMGNTKFLVELIRRYPDLIWKVNDNNQSIFHIAVKHRHEGIYNLLYEIGSMKDLITPLKDENENNMLHLVGKSAKRKRLQDVSGVALQMQRELLWFKEVEAMIPPSYREKKNKDDLTPHELFTKEHKVLVTVGEEWMKGTASQCMVVAALIATIVFAAAFTVPGGYDQTKGTPIFFHKVTFKIFVVADALSLISSSASILMFLAILTSRYAERDFEESLPRKLMFGLASLFLSITTMMIAFSISFFVLYHKNLKWMPILISGLAGLPVLLYLRLQLPLLYDVFRSTYGSRYLFKPTKHVLYDTPSSSRFRFCFQFVSTFKTCLGKLM